MKRAAFALVLLLLTVLPIAASPLGNQAGATLLFSFSVGVSPFGGRVRFPITLEMSCLLPSMVGFGAGFLQTGEMFVLYGLAEYGVDPFDGDVLYLPVKARAGWGRMYGQSSWMLAVSAGMGAVLPVEGTSFSNPFLADVQGLATAAFYFERADGKRFELFPEAGAGIYLAGD